MVLTFTPVVTDEAAHAALKAAKFEADTALIPGRIADRHKTEREKIWAMTHMIKDFYLQGFGAIKPAHPDVCPVTFCYQHDRDPAVQLRCKFQREGGAEITLASPFPEQPNVVESLRWQVSGNTLEYTGPVQFKCSGAELENYTPAGREHRMSETLEGLHSLFVAQKDVLLQPVAELFYQKQARNPFAMVAHTSFKGPAAHRMKPKEEKNYLKHYHRKMRILWGENARPVTPVTNLQTMRNAFPQY